MKRTIGICIFFTLIAVKTVSQTTVKVDLMKSSWLSIKGSTNVIPFKLIHNGENLLGKSIILTASQQQNKIYLSQNQLSIQVKDFSSDNLMALKDFQKLIKSDIYPTIKVQLKFIETLKGKEEDVYSKGNAWVNITITGITKQYKIPVWSSKNCEYITVGGESKISIQDFDLKPPVEMFGLIKVSEWININFCMVCKLTIDKNLALQVESDDSNL